MDIISFNEAATANSRIEIINANPDSTSGIVTVPKTIASGETVTVPAGRVAVLPNVVVDGDLVVEAGGEIFVPAGANFSDLEGQIALKADTSYVNGKYSGFKNYIINGNFDIWQRGTSFSSVGYTADRWHLAIGGSAVATKHNDAPNMILLSTTAASSFANLYQAIETATVVGLRGKTLTLSLKIAIGGTHTGGFALSARYSNSTDILISQTTTIQSLGISASSANTRYSLTFTVPADAVGLRLDIENTSVQPSGALYQVQEVQLEEGSVATPFENRPYGLELSLCQRYYEKILTSIRAYADGGGFYWTIPMKVNKRDTPTIIQGTSFSGQNVSASTRPIAISQENITYLLMPVVTGFCTMDNLSLEIISEL